MTGGNGIAARLRTITERVLSGSATVFVLLGLILVVISVLNPKFLEPGSLMLFIKKAAPLVLLAIGQYFVIVSGEFDLSVGSLVGAQVVIAALLINGVESATVPVILGMFVGGALIGLVNGLVTTLLKVPSIIATLGMMLVLYGAIRWLTGGAPTGALSESFRVAGRQGIDGVPVIGQIPWALLIMVALGIGAGFLMRSSWGRTLVAVGDNERAATFAGARAWWVKTSAFILSGLLATAAGILLGGYAGVTAQVGQGLEFTAITAVVLGGVVLGGGRGWVVAAMAGALTVEALFRLFTQLNLPSTIRPTAQGLIIIAAVAYAAVDRARRQRTPTTIGTPRHSDVAS
ncbi:monosaccharide ABC transporter membrane protein (CUT2 family) [Stackebrandtia endophytica]|uniref:Autoinducer 2 import system permease protein LsrD n=1 Tax=Stackebrandtia endophytica TaxID=1496996 RepID=A0A543AUT2_9ACTN|nr:ABC transporter permease [Stackebrandtia endophytica]TQL76346.1 monosaccharide ABC transporter membrane protein (CUT2 family) [Stackebrandtia endophytica]